MSETTSILLVSFIKAGIVWTGIIWVVTVAMYQVFEHRRRDEFKRLRALRKKFPNHNLRPKGPGESKDYYWR